MTICKRCNTKDAEPGSINWLLFLPLLALFPFPSSQGFCKDCAGGLNFVGFLLIGALLIAVFVLAVILW